MEEPGDHIEELFQLCVRMYERMERENSWPWVTDPEWWKAREAEQAKEHAEPREAAP